MKPHQETDRQRRQRLGSLHRLAALLGESLPACIHAENPHGEWLVRDADASQKELIPLVLELSAHLARLYHRHRVRLPNGCYEASIEDVAAVLGLLRHELGPLSAAGAGARSLHALMLGRGALTRREVQELAGLSKTHTARLLNELHLLGLADREGYANRGYRHRAVSATEFRARMGE